MKLLETVFEFEWDGGNRGKNMLRHRVADREKVV